MLRTFVSKDRNRIASIHSKAFPGFFLSSLGSRFLEAYYASMSEASGSIFLVDDEHGIRGFACGCIDPAGFNRRFVRTHLHLLIASSLRALLKDPRTIFRMLTRPKDIVAQPHEEGIIHLLSICVAPEFEGRGIGKSLLTAFKKASASAGARCVYLTTDARDNDPVNVFYRKNGFLLIGSHDSGNGRIMNEYEFELEATNGLESPAFQA